MAKSVSDIAYSAPVGGPSARFSIGPDAATRVMLRRWHSVFGDLYRVRPQRGDDAHWVVHDPGLVRQILVANSANYAKGMGMGRVRMLLGDEPFHRFAYIPFAAGPRHCIGEHLALTEMRIHLAQMLRAFTPAYAGDHPPHIESRINLRPVDGIYLQLRRR